MADNAPHILQEAVLPASSVESQFRHQRVHDGESRANTVCRALIHWATGAGSEKEQCPICFESFTVHTFEKDSEILIQEVDHGSAHYPVLTPCMHKFGSACLGHWLLASDSCPLCRRELLSHGITRLDCGRPTRHAHSDETRNFHNDLEDIAAPARAITRSLSSSSRTTSAFRQQRWDARMGGLGYPYFDDPINVAVPRSAPTTSQAANNGVRMPSATTTHGHPTTSTPTTAFSAGYVRRTYENVNITSYDLSNQANDIQVYPPNTRSHNSLSRHWDYLSRTRRGSTANYFSRHRNLNARETYSVASGLGIATGVGTVAGMPRGERTIPRRGRIVPSGGDSAAAIREETSNDYSIAAAMGQVMGIGTVVGMPRAEWRNSRRNASRSERMSNASLETLTTMTSRSTRFRETSNVEDDLAGFPRLSSSIWAPHSR